MPAGKGEREQNREQKESRKRARAQEDPFCSRIDNRMSSLRAKRMRSIWRLQARNRAQSASLKEA